MRAGAKTPWVLAAVAALLGLYIAVFERKHETTDEARATRQVIFPGLVRGDVSAIGIDRGAKGKVALIRDSSAAASDAWRVDPGGAPVARGAVGDLLDTIDGLDIDRIATATAQEARLEPPAARLVLTTPERRFALDIGGSDASGRGVFVRRDGDARIFVVGGRLRDLADRDANAFRNRQLFTAASVDGATTLVFRSENGPPQTLRKRAGLWLNEGGRWATRAAVGEALRMLAALQVNEFLPGPHGDAGAPAAPRGSVEVSGAGSQPAPPAHLEVFSGDCAPQGELAAFTVDGRRQTGAPEWICLDRRDVDRLWRQLEAANRRDPHLLVADPAGIADVELIEGERRVHLHRNGDRGWRFLVPTTGYEADEKVVADWLGQLATIPLVDGSPLVREDDARATRRLVVDGAMEIRVGPPRRGQSHVDRAGEAVPALVGAAAFAALDPDPLRFRSREVLALPQFDVRVIEIHRSHAAVKLSREAATNWVRQGAAESPNATTVDHLLSLLSDLRAESFVTPQPTSFKPDTTVDIEVHSGETPAQHHRLDLAAKCHARVDNAPVFVLAAKTCEDIERTVAGLK